MIRLLFEAVRICDRPQVAKKMIIEYFQDIHEMTDDYGNTLLHIATDSKHYQIVQFILKYYTEQEIINPQHYDDEKKKRWINLKNNNGFTAFHFAIFRHQGKIINLLEKNGADIYLISQDGLNALHLSAQGGSPLLIYYFIGKGFKISCIDSKGNTALHWAVYAGMENAVSALLAWGAQRDIQEDSNLMTPLHYAVVSDNIRIVKKLLLFGCDKTIKNKKGQTALDLAIEKDYLNMAQVIKDQTGILQLLNIRPRYRRMKKRTFPFYCFTFTFFICYFINFAYIYPPNQLELNHLTLINFGLGFLLVLLYVLLVISDPGKLHQREDTNLLYLLKTYHAGQICYNCNILKPARSRHCIICDKCVSVYDHHCPWIANCVGSNNYLKFFIFVIFLVIYLLYNMSYHIINLVQIVTDDINAYQILKIIASAINLLICLIFIIPVTYLLFTHFKNLFNNKTTFQTYSKVDEQATLNKVNPLKKKRRTTIVSSIIGRSQYQQDNTQKQDSLFYKQSLKMSDSQMSIKKNKGCMNNCLLMLYYNNHNEIYKLVS